MEKIASSHILKTYPEENKAWVDRLLNAEIEKSRRKIIVLDDDPTGIQTVHGVSVYTDWSMESIRAGFGEANKLFFLLTNSRGFTVDETTKAHIEIAERIDTVSKEFHTDYLIVSRGDSTLRGHYPLETSLIRAVEERQNTWKIDGEILCPYFREGGRFTIGNIHYVKYGEELIPAGQTEFAMDRTFGYTESDLRRYVEEKTDGNYRADDVCCISLETLRSGAIDKIVEALDAVKDFNKIVVNAMDDYDVKIFCIALYRALDHGKHYLFRTAAAFVKALGNISDKPLLCREEMVTLTTETGGIIVVGSHTQKTTRQVEELKKLSDVIFLEMNSDLVLKEGELEKEVDRIVLACDKCIHAGKTVTVCTKRQLLVVENDTKEEALLRSVKISDAVQSVVAKLSATPSFVIAKGGITSSDVGTKALGVKRAYVLGQIRPGIPVWQTGKESKFPGTPYIIFPGNVGDVTTLREAVEILL